MRVDAGEAAEGGFLFGFESPMTGPVAVEDFVKGAGGAAAGEDGGADFDAAGFQEVEAGGAGLGEGVDDRAEQVFAGGGKSEVGEGSVFLLDAGAFAGEIGIEGHGLGSGIAAEFGEQGVILRIGKIAKELMACPGDCGTGGGESADGKPEASDAHGGG